jgi:uncharacterized protein YggL (DUF469 family)
MSKKEEAFEQGEIKLNRLKEKLHISELQFERIKSTIFKSQIWDENINNAFIDFMDECEEEEKAEINFRYESAKLASTSAKALWEQCNKCLNFDLSKESMILILNNIIEYFEIFAYQFNNNEDTEILINLKKTLEEIKQM